MSAAAGTGRRLFVGRDAQLDALLAVYDQAASGTPGIVLITGPAGIGKSALVRTFLDGIDATIFRASGAEEEADLDLGVAGQLLAGHGSLPDEGDTTPWEGASEAMDLGARLLDRVGAAQSERPTVIVVDDVQWCDHASLKAVCFLARRLRHDRVMMILVSRKDASTTVPRLAQRLAVDVGGRRLRLTGLDEDAVAGMAEAMGAGPLSRSAALRLRDHTLGNPMHVAAILEEVPASALRVEAAGPLPAPRSFAALVMARLGTCSQAARSLADAASVLGDRSTLAVATELAGLDDVGRPLDELVGAGIVTMEGSPGTVIFTHPLMRAAVYHGLGPGRRTALHRAAADLTDDPLAILRHRVAGALGPDAGLASDLSAFARSSADRGLWSLAASHFTAAASVTPSPADRRRRVLAAAECMLVGGDVARASNLLVTVEELEPDAAGEYVLGRLHLVSGRRAEAIAHLHRGWAAAALPDDAGTAARIAGLLAHVTLNEGRADEAADWARRSLSLDPVASPDARTALILALGCQGRFADALAAVGPVPERPSEACPSPSLLGRVLGRGIVRLWLDDLEAAWRDLVLVERWARHGGTLQTRLLALLYLADAEYRLGKWDESIVHAELAVSLAADGDHAWVGALAHAVAAFPLAARGMWDDATSHVQAAFAAAEAQGDAASWLWARTAAGRLAQARGRPADAVEALLPLLQMSQLHGAGEPGIQPWLHLYAESLVALGRADAAAEALASLEASASGRQHRTALVNSARVRGQLAWLEGEVDQAEAAFAGGASHRRAGNEPVSPLADALLDTAHGSFLRRRGLRRDAAEHLARSQRVLSRLQAEPFLRRCQRELAACGIRPARQPGPAHAPALTPQERAVASLVGTGLSNKEVAAELFISVKTVEYHLGHVFAKVGVSSRSALAAQLAGTGDDGTYPTDTHPTTGRR